MSAAHWQNPKWRYRSRAETEKPGYLARRFAEIRREQEAAAKETAAKVKPIKREAKS